MSDRDNYSSLFGTFVNYGRKSFITLDPGADVIKLSTEINYECL
jgi:hypothetical protein